MNRTSASPLLAIPPDQSLPELTVRGVLLGALITVVFTAANVFLGLKVGLTFSSSIPAAVISMAVLRLLPGANMLENNMVQTQASAAGTLSSVIFVLPALVMMGWWQGFPFWLTLALCAAGGMLGVLFTIPLRRVMVVQSDLPYPEGVAAAEILRTGAAAAGDRAGGGGLADLAAGGVVAGLVSFATSGLKVLGDGLSVWFSAGAAVFRLPMGFSLALVGAGYLVGIGAGVAMLLGLVIAWGVAVPLLTGLHEVAAAATPQATAAAAAAQVRFIGAGIIAVGAVWTLVMLFKPITQGLKASFAGMFGAGAGVATDVGAGAGVATGTGTGNIAAAAPPRTEQDLRPRWISALALLLVAALAATCAMFLVGAPQGGRGVAVLVVCAVAFAVVFGFLVAAACGYMAGLVGSSTSPISGVGIVAMVLVSGMLLAIGAETGEGGARLAVALALFTTAAIVAVAAISNDNLQDLKTGWLVGATPWRQQVALLIGCLVGAAVVAPVLNLLYQAYGFTGALPRPGMDPDQALAAPQATLMLAIAQGIITHHLNWTMILTGIAIGAALIIVDEVLKRTTSSARLPVLAVGIGAYLPPTATAPLVVGALLAWAVGRYLRRSGAERIERAERRGTLLACGLIVGESLVGVALAAVIGFSGHPAPLALVGASFEDMAQWLGLAVFAAVLFAYARRLLTTR
ncbi:OPT family oligopeptide transporter [Bordetella sp. LUAb4]|uniref:OPT family oligopeptide transporter n=1 Tax=Bordetella sp. LUAb4 TaxID=2843195 RepID=UPI001E4F3371|nr:oligopeptide transporter, OPT family [Bordetella sp. LUAb4]